MSVLRIIGTWNCPHSSVSRFHSQVGEDDLEETRFLTKLFKGEFLQAFDMIANAEETGLFNRMRVSQLLDRLLESMS